MDLEEETMDLMEMIHVDTPLEIRKYPTGKQGANAWSHPMIVMVVEMLAHRAPPSSIAPIILTVLQICVPNWNIVKYLPGENWIRQCCMLLVYITKTLAAMKLGFAREFKQLFMDGTNHRTHFQ